MPCYQQSYHYITLGYFGAKAAGEAIGLVLLIAGAGGIISPILVTWLASTYGWYVGWYVTAAAAGLGFIISMILPRYSPDRGYQ